MNKWFFILLLLWPGVIAAGNLHKKIQNFVNDYSSDSNIELQKVKVKPEWNKKAKKMTHYRFYFNHFLYSPIVQNEKTIGHLFIDKAMGKGSSFVVGVIFDTNKIIQSISIFEDSSRHGMRLNMLSHKKQYYGTGPGSHYTVGKDIDGISGSSYSARGLSRSIWRLTLVINDLIP